MVHFWVLQRYKINQGETNVLPLFQNYIVHLTTLKEAAKKERSFQLYGVISNTTAAFFIDTSKLYDAL